MVTTGKRYTPKEIERYVDAVTPEDIKRVAQKYLWDKDVRSVSHYNACAVADPEVQFALAAVGRTEAILDYNRIRAGEFESRAPCSGKRVADYTADMSSMLY